MPARRPCGRLRAQMRRSICDAVGRRRQVASPTAITDVVVPKSSVTVVDVAGSGVHRVPSTMKAYWWSPGGSGSDTAHTPAAPAGRSGVAPRCQSLKSPTSATLDADGAWSTKRTMRTVSVLAVADATVCAALGGRHSVRPTIAPATAITTAAATAVTAEYEMWIVRRRV